MESITMKISVREKITIKDFKEMSILRAVMATLYNFKGSSCGDSASNERES
jgi:hypothetical protein